MTGVTSVLVLSEVRHRLLRAEVIAKHGIPGRNAVRYMRQHPQIIAQLTDTRRTFRELRRWPLRLVHLTRRQLWQSLRISERLGLLTHDALHVATLRAHGLRHLASADHDFDAVPGLTRWSP